MSQTRQNPPATPQEPEQPRRQLDPQTTSTITMAVLVVVFLIFLGWGWVAATKPLPQPDLGTETTSVCSMRTFEEGDALTPADVAVNVYNASDRSQLARETMTALTQRGFVAGTVGDAPDDMQVDRAEIRATGKYSAAAILVRENIGQPVIVTEDSGAVGIDVYVGPNWDGLRGETLSTITLSTTEEVCGPEETELP